MNETHTAGVETGEDQNAPNVLLTKFYTALYHANLAPSVFDEAESAYLAFNKDASTGDVRTVGAEAGDHRAHAYTDMSIWDIHRTQLPWLSLTAPDVYTDVLRSVQAMSTEGAEPFPPFHLSTFPPFHLNPDS
jgi:putative alpha-1,2-mannosidase